MKFAAEIAVSAHSLGALRKAGCLALPGVVNGAVDGIQIPRGPNINDRATAPERDLRSSRTAFDVIGRKLEELTKRQSEPVSA
jgi:hypothetical protein